MPSPTGPIIGYLPDGTPIYGSPVVGAGGGGPVGPGPGPRPTPPPDVILPGGRVVHTGVVLGKSAPPKRRGEGTPPKTINGAASPWGDGPTAAVTPGGALGIPYGKFRVEGTFFNQDTGDVLGANFACAWCAGGPGGISSIDSVFINDVNATALPGVSFSHYLGTYTQAVEGWLSALGYPQRYPGVVWSRIFASGTAQTPWWKSLPVDATQNGIRATVEGTGRKLTEPRENMLPQSENFAIAGAPWTTATAPATVVATGVGDPFGGTAAGRWTGGATGFDCYQYFTTLQSDQANALTGSIWLRAVSGTVACTLTVKHITRAGGAASTTALGVTATTTWQRFSATDPAGAATGGQALFEVATSVNGGNVEVFGAQLEAFSSSRGYIKTAGTAIFARENLFPHSETYSNTYWSTDFTFPTLTTAIADPFVGAGGAAGQWVFGVSPQNIYRIGPALAMGQPSTFSVWLRTTSGTAALTLFLGPQGSYTNNNVTVTTTWTRFTVSAPPAASAALCIAGLTNLPSSQTLQAFGAQLEMAPSAGAYIGTDTFTGGAAAIPRPFLTSANPALAIRDWLADPVYGMGVALSQIDEASFGQAAAYCDEPVSGFPRFSINGLFVGDATGEGLKAQLLETCGGDLFEEKGRYRLLIPGLLSTPVLALDTATNCREVQYAPMMSGDVPSRMIIRFRNMAKRWAEDSVHADDPGIVTGAVELRETTITLDGVNDERQAQRLCNRRLNRALLNLRVTTLASFSGILLTRGSLFTLTTSDGLVAQAFTVLDFNRQASGEYQITGVQYADTLFSETTITPDTPPSTNFIDFHPGNAPDDVAFATVVGSPASVYWTAPRYMDTGHVPVAQGWVNAGSTVYAYLDLGAGVTAKIAKFKSKMLFGSNAYAGTGCEWSDDNAAWTAVTGFVASAWKHFTSPTSYDLMVAEWTTTAAAHRYWRVNMGTGYSFSPDLSTSSLLGVLAETDPEVVAYEVHNSSANLLLSFPQNDPIFVVIPASSLPTSTVPLDLRGMVYSAASAGLSTVRPYIIAVRRSGTRSTGFILINDSAGAGFFVGAQSAAGGPVQAGVSAAIGGTMLAATLVATAVAPTVAAGQVGYGATTATTANAGVNGAPPAQVVGYIIVNVAGTARKIAYYAT